MDSLPNSWKATSSSCGPRTLAGPEPCTDRIVPWKNELMPVLFLLAILGLMFWAVIPP